MKKAKLLLKVLLSLWIVYNIVVMLIMPNIGSYLGRSMSRYITPYAGAVGLSAGWDFFSPDPAHTLYIEYTVYFPHPAQGEGEPRDPVEGYFPPEKNLPVHDPVRKRDLYATRYMALSPKRLRVVFGPWLCRQYPGASQVNARIIIETVPPLDKVVKLPEMSLADLSERIEYAKEDISCGSRDEELL
ncbi:hypothetical protein AZI86_14165 [Bdellovibrio bacteriovorus]|uniref:Uncharacterized protein n=1 Tax=Bdellovibrio bacteriovorus TaxID=959 RepID=A0A150WK84_BDEBC|nr:hypothetical protein [Bdellovibrio bacteriovorus]KYG63951.1 hypothetical protein AZI86_14165 [Bdellovibrio bacteriovorus]